MARITIKKNIYPYCFIARDVGIERLDNPLALIASKLEGAVRF